MAGAFDGPYGNIRANQPEMIEAGMFTSSVQFSGTTGSTITSGLLVSPSSVDPAGTLVIHGVTVVNAGTAGQAFIVRVYGGSSGKTVCIGGGNRFGPFLYNFDQPFVLDAGEECIYHILESGWTGVKFVFLNYSVNRARA